MELTELMEWTYQKIFQLLENKSSGPVSRNEINAIHDLLDNVFAAFGDKEDPCLPLSVVQELDVNFFVARENFLGLFQNFDEVVAHFLKIHPEWWTSMCEENSPRLTCSHWEDEGLVRCVIHSSGIYVFRYFDK